MREKGYVWFSQKCPEKHSLQPALQTVVLEKPAMKPQPTLNTVLQMTSENNS